MSGFVDDAKYKQLSQKLREVYEEMGMSVVQQTGQVDDDGDLFIITVAMVRKTAFRQLTEDVETREQFSKQMAHEAQARIDAQADAIRKAAEEGRILDVLMGNQELVTCSHERIHEGLCLDCQKEVVDDETT